MSAKMVIKIDQSKTQPKYSNILVTPVLVRKLGWGRNIATRVYCFVVFVVFCFGFCFDLFVCLFFVCVCVFF